MKKDEATIRHEKEIERLDKEIFKREAAMRALEDIHNAMDDLCVHQDGSIASGKLEEDVVECPLHFWHYNIKTGELTDYLKDVKLQTYPVESRDDGIYIDI